MWPSERFIQFGLALIAGHGPGVFWILSAGSEIMACHGQGDSETAPSRSGAPDLSEEQTKPFRVSWRAF
jgi:hypothetical protein